MASLALKTYARSVRSPAAAGAALAALAGMVFLVLPLLRLPYGQVLEDLSYDSLYWFRDRESVSNVVLVYMDQPSHEKLDEEWFKNWDRSRHAQLIDRLRQWGSRAVVFDLLFAGEGNDPAADAHLVEAAVRHGRVVVAAKRTPRVYEGELLAFTLSKPFPALETNVVWGMVEESYEGIREHYRGSKEAPSLAWRAAELTMEVPPDPNRRRWVRYYGPPGLFPHHSFYAVLEGAPELSGQFSNQVVFVGTQFDVGNTGGRGTDDFVTPYTSRGYGRSTGTEIIATTYMNLVRDDWLRRFSPGVELVLVVGLGLGLGYGLASVVPWTALVAGLLIAAGLGLASLTVGWQARVWFPWLIVAGVQVPCALGWSMFAHNKRLRQEMQRFKQGAALVGGGNIGFEPGGMGAGATRVLPPQWGGPGGGEAAPVAAGSAAEDHLPVVPDHVLLRSIGRGAYGDVWLARDVIGTYHAVKTVHRRIFHDQTPFEREFRGITKFTPLSRSHPGFVHILHVGRNEPAGYFYYVMELGDDEVTGQKIDPDRYSARNLAREIKARRRLPLRETLWVGIALADAMEYLHQNLLVHRDIKPSNIIFVKGQPKFADIGLVTDVASEARDVSYIGTQGYIAPEGPGTPAADVFSLGKVLYEMATGLDRGRFPELPTTLVESPDDCGIFRLNKVILTACEKDLRKRYPTAAALRDALKGIDRELPQEVESPESPRVV